MKENEALLEDEDNDKQTLFKFFGIQLTAPKDLKYPRIIYIGFIVINLMLLYLLTKVISGI